MAQKPTNINTVDNTWTNQFGDRITYHGDVFDKGGYVSNYAIVYNGKYLKTVGSLNSAKGTLNKLRDIKCTWIASKE